MQRLCRVGGLCKAVKNNRGGWGEVKAGLVVGGGPSRVKGAPSELLSPERGWRWWLLMFGTAARRERTASTSQIVYLNLTGTGGGTQYPLWPPPKELCPLHSLCWQPWRREDPVKGKQTRQKLNTFHYSGWQWSVRRKLIRSRIRWHLTQRGLGCLV